MKEHKTYTWKMRIKNSVLTALLLFFSLTLLKAQEIKVCIIKTSLGCIFLTMLTHRSCSC